MKKNGAKGSSGQSSQYFVLQYKQSFQRIKTRQIRDRNRCFLSEGVVIYIERQKATIIIKKY